MVMIMWKYLEKKSREKLGDIKDFLPKNNKETHNLY